MHRFEEIGLAKFFKIHLEFYAPLIKIYKLSTFGRENPNYIPDKIKELKENITKKTDNTDYSIATYSLIGGVVGIFLILSIYFITFKNQIMAQLGIKEVLFKVFINASLILLFELLFLYFVYGNTDLFNFQKIFGI
jgi:hypothetical protein